VNVDTADQLGQTLRFKVISTGDWRWGGPGDKRWPRRHMVIELMWRKARRLEEQETKLCQPGFLAGETRLEEPTEQ
jgi:hypothetical protein